MEMKKVTKAQTEKDCLRLVSMSDKDGGGFDVLNYDRLIASWRVGDNRSSITYYTPCNGDERLHRMIVELVNVFPLLY